MIGDRLDITGARWGLQGAEAILTLRAVIVNGDYDDYRRYHLACEHQRALPRHSRRPAHTQCLTPHSQRAAPKFLLAERWIRGKPFVYESRHGRSRPAGQRSRG